MVLEKNMFPTKAQLEDKSRRAVEQKKIDMIKSEREDAIHNENICNEIFKLSITVMSSEHLRRNSKLIPGNFTSNGKLSGCGDYERFLNILSKRNVTVVKHEFPNYVTYDPIEKTFLFERLQHSGFFW